MRRLAPAFSGLLLVPVLLVTLSLTLACSSGGNQQQGDPRPANCLGKCDGTEFTFQSNWEMDLAAFGAAFPGPALTSAEDAFTVQVDLGEAKFPAPTHLFGVPVNVIPYSNDDNVVDAAGETVLRGDTVISQAFPPDSIGWAVKHHRPEYRTLAPTDLAANMKEQMKLQDTHIELVVGVYREGEPGVVTLNNPQNYERGFFGTPDYPMVFLKPKFPDYVGSEEKGAFTHNIRTMMLAFNAVSNFPGNYNGGDPLAANAPDRVIEHVRQMVLAITGDSAAQAFFADPANQIYCAELAHVSASAGILAPLNDSFMIPLVGEPAWTAFKAQVDEHNNGSPSAFTTMNENVRAALVKATLAPESLKALPDYAPSEVQAADRQKLAFQPMTMADIIQQFMRTHVPREILGESLAPVQAQLLQQMKPGILEAMAMDQIPASDPRRIAVDGLYDEMVSVVGQSYADYAAFQEALAPVMAAARQMTGPRDDTGAGLFVPPSALHVIAQGKLPGGLVGLEYVGHGVHVSQAKKKPAPTEPVVEEPPADPADSPFAGSCRMSCGAASPGNSCYCDTVCVNYGDCCDDIAEFCPGS